MKISELCNKTGFKPVCGDTESEIGGVYACDLLSWVIGRARRGDALVTVMTNVNVIAVAVMAELSCVILTEGAALDAAALEKARENSVAVVSSDLSSYATCVELARASGEL